MAEIQYRCEVAEKKRARSAWERHQEEKRAALQRAAEEAERKKQEEMKTLTADLTRKLKNEASLQREIAISEALAVARVNSTILNNYLVFLEALCTFFLREKIILDSTIRFKISLNDYFFFSSRLHSTTVCFGILVLTSTALRL